MHPHPDAGPHEVRLVPLDEIDDAAVARDRTVLARDAMTELQLSIAASGLRLPIEVFELETPGDDRRYGLLSGWRRLMAFHALNDLRSDDRFARIPALLRGRRDRAGALASVIEENEIRAGLTAWERGRVVWRAHAEEMFPTIEEAAARLFPSADRMKQSRIRGLAHAVDALEGFLTAPESLSQRQLLRVAAAARMGLSDVMRAALQESSLDDPETQWRLLLPILEEAESSSDEPPPRRLRRDCPRRLWRPDDNLCIRREKTRDGYTLHFTGRDARSGVLDAVFDEIERMLGKE